MTQRTQKPLQFSESGHGDTETTITKPFWTGRRVLVTGASGLVGGALLPRLLEAGARVVTLSRSVRRTRPGAMEAPLWIQGTVEDADRMKRVVAEHDPQVVFHLAGQTGSGRAQQEPAETFEVNIRGTWNLLEAVRICGIRPAVVLASSDAVYGTEGPRPHREEQPAHGTSPYAVSKLCAEAIGRAYAGAYGIAVSAARCSNVYGPGDHQATRLVPAAIQAILRGQPPALTAEPSAVRDFLFVEDAARGLLRLAEWAEAARPRGEAVNLCSGQAATIAEVLEAILALMGRPDLRPPQLVGATPSATEPLASAEQALRLLGWRAQVSLETGLQQTVEWYRTQDTHDTRRRAPAFR